MNLTPNIKKLVIQKCSLDALPPGSTIADGARFLTEPDRLSKGMHEAAEWVDAAILAIRRAGDPNPFRNASDEDIAEEILRRIKERKNENRRLQQTDRTTEKNTSS